MVQAELIVMNEEGIHLGPANKIVNVADKFQSDIRFKSDYMHINAKSIIGLVSGTFRKGDTIVCICEGPDEKEALESMKQMLSKNLEL